MKTERTSVLIQLYICLISQLLHNKVYMINVLTIQFRYTYCFAKFVCMSIKRDNIMVIFSSLYWVLPIYNANQNVVLIKAKHRIQDGLNIHKPIFDCSCADSSSKSEVRIDL